MEQATGDGDALGLPLAESAAPFTQFGVETIGQVEHKVGTGGMQHFAQFGFGGLGLRYLQVITDVIYSL